MHHQIYLIIAKNTSWRNYKSWWSYNKNGGRNREKGRKPSTYYPKKGSEGRVDAGK
jgi:hypothetical protein